jgi:hypothetical protein
LYAGCGATGFAGAGAGVVGVLPPLDPGDPLDEDPPEEDPPEDDEPPLEALDFPFEPDDALVLADFALGEGNGVNGLRVGPELWYLAPPGVSDTASFGFAEATVTDSAGEVFPTGTLGTTAVPVELPPDPPLSAYATAASSPTTTSTSSGNRRRESRSDLTDCSISLMGSPLRQQGS